MKRCLATSRPSWQNTVESQGLIFHTPDGNTYWDESIYYEFTANEVDALEAATNELHEMALNTVQHVIDKYRFAELAIPDWAAQLVCKSWEAEPPAIYGRFDLTFDGRNIHMLEYNADTPTSLLEAAVIQWYWLKDQHPNRDQFNSIHERLIAKWKELIEYMAPVVHFASSKDREDEMTVAYLQDTAKQAGVETQRLHMEDVGWNEEGGAFADLYETPIGTLFKLYPWEWLINEEFGKNIPRAPEVMQWMEPAWKMVLSNKGILPIMHELYPRSKYILKAYKDSPRDLTSYVKKPLLSREGANVSIIMDGVAVVDTAGDYGEEGFIYQEISPSLLSAGFGSKPKYPVLGSWVIDGVSAGVGIRESDTLVTGNLSRFVPHLF